MARVTRSGKSADNAEVVTKAAPKTGTKRLKKKEVTKTTPKTTTVVKADTDVEDERHDSPHVTPTKTSKRGRKRKSEATEEEPEKAVKRRGRPPKKPKTTAESTIGSTVTSKTSKPSSVVTTSQPSVGRRKRGSNRTDTKSFTQREKKAFYECLQSKGLSCLKNEELLLEVLPNRTITEINAFIDTYSRKAQELNRRSDEAMNGGSNSTSNKQPIEKWFELIHQSIPNASKKDDISAILIDIFGDIKIEDKEPKSEIKSEMNPDLIPDFKQIYGCIKDALDGQYAPPLRPMDAFVMVNLIEELKDLLRSDDYSKETDYLASGKWWSNKKSAEDMFSDIFTRRQQQNAAENGDTGAETTVISKPVRQKGKSRRNGSGSSAQELPTVMEGPSTSTMAAIADARVQSLQDFPKMRWITECLNPIKIPTELMAKEFQRWQRL